MLYRTCCKNIGELFWLHTELIEFRSKHHEHVLNFFKLPLGNQTPTHLTHCFANFAHNFDAVSLVALAPTKKHGGRLHTSLKHAKRFWVASQLRTNIGRDAVTLSNSFTVTQHGVLSSFTKAHAVDSGKSDVGLRFP